MSDIGWDKQASPYHPGEQELHARLGRKERQDAIARQIHRPVVIEQHSAFFAQLPFIVAGSVDHDGGPWASILFGIPGFISTPDPRRVEIATSAVQGDPFTENAKPGAPVGFVGIELPTRRRNRLNGMINTESAKKFIVDVVQSYGNCPQYIHTRDMQFTRDPHLPYHPPRESFTTLGPAERDMITNADTFFVASHNDRDDPRVNGGVDANHRGGSPGFVKVEGDTLTIPDFRGNFAFNTLGNFLVNPKAGLLFVDFDNGDLLQMTGEAELLWDMTDEIAAFRGAQRAWRFHLSHGHRLIGAAPLRFEFGEISPSTRRTRDWLTA